MSLQISRPADHFDSWDAAAESDGCNLSDWILSCCEANLPPKVVQQLSPRRPTPRRKKRRKKKRDDSNLTSRIDIRCSDDRTAAINDAAKAAGMNRSEWIGWCCNANLQARAAAQLSEPRPAHRPAERDD